jgi:CBS domain containing-hemolysin-like protein
MSPTTILLKLLAVGVLVAINAYFVAAEFALVACRRTRIEQLARSGNARALRVQRALDDPESFISAAQLGITVASIAIGFMAEGTLQVLILPIIERGHGLFDAIPFITNPVSAAHVVSTAITLIFVTFVHVVIGEQVPKMVAIQEAEAIAMWTVAPTQMFARAFRPFITLMSKSAAGVMHLFGMKPTGVHALAHTIDELRLLVEQSHEEGIVKADQEQMITGVFEFREIRAREIMTPRPDIMGLPVTATPEEVIAFAVEQGHSRIPVYEGTIDGIVGVLLAKDLLAEMAKGRAFELRGLMREPLFIPDTKRMDVLLAEFRTRSVHMAIVVDEFGGTMGLVTMEDLLEQIVGDIFDEHDQPEPEFEMTPDGAVLIDGGVAIGEVNERFGLELPEEDFDTIGGFVFGELGRMPVAGDQVLVPGGRLVVDETLDRRVTRVRLLRATEKRVPISPGE